MNHEQNAILLEKRYSKKCKLIRDMKKSYNSQISNLFVERDRLQTEIKRINGHVAGELLPEINRLREERDSYRQELDGMIKAFGETSVSSDNKVIKDDN